MTKSLGVHVVHKNKEWTIIGTKKKGLAFGTQKKAITAARRLAKKNKAELVIHKKTGKVRGRSSYSLSKRT